MIAVILSLLLLLLPKQVAAWYDPLTVPNNTYGMHIADFNDLAGVAGLVNTNGGDWGYITIVASDNDRDSGKWQAMFDVMRRLHLIPIVRLATHVDNASWVAPSKESIDKIVTFLTNLNWPTENRYVILYNEPNHSKEWGGSVDPEGYVDLLVEYSQKLKKSSEDFFVLPAGLDASAAHDGVTMDAEEFLKRMVKAKPELFEHIDGWTSHAYPNPGFSGSPYATGRGTLKTYEWELGVLRSLGLKKKLPIFITETGWQHSEGKSYMPGLLSPEAVASNFRIAFTRVWNDPGIVAVTPFLFNYQDVPFDHFSWKTLGGDGLYPFASELLGLSKTKGFPRQREEYVVLETLLPPTLVAGSSYTFSSDIQNNGQGILTSNEYEAVFTSKTPGFAVTSGPLPTLEPEEKGPLLLLVETPDKPGTYNVSLAFRRNDRTIPVLERTIEVVPPPSLTVTTQLGWNPIGTAADVKVLIYEGDTLIHKFTGLSMNNSVVTVEGLYNIIPDQAYRIVIVVPYYLPRQTTAPIGKQKTAVSMKRLLPFDIDNDGALTIKDLFALPKEQPRVIRQRFFGP